MRTCILCILSVFFLNFSYAQKSEIKGTIKDALTGETLVGASVLVAEGVGVVSDIDGNFSIQVDQGQYTVKISFVGYATQELKITVGPKAYVLTISLESIVLDEVEVVADVAISRETPVAFSTISAKLINEELGSRDLPMVLNSTPGAYATQQGGGSGDARVSIRGFDQRNIAVMVDGVPVNDMENGWVYWSNWDGLGDITRTMQVQRGLGASKLAIASVGGTINILTNGIDQKLGGSVKQEVNSFGLLKTSFGFTSGKLKGDWGITIAGSRKWGDNWADGTYHDGWSYFVKVQKRLKKHLFSLSANGAPQQHGQRNDRMVTPLYSKALGTELGIDTDSIYSSSVYTTATQAERGLKYNPNWGYLNGEVMNERLNYFHKPQFNFSHFWSPNDKFNLSTVAYVSIGRGGGTGLRGSVPRDTLTGQLNFDYTFANNSTALTPLYSTTENSSGTYLRASINNHSWYGVLSTMNYKINDQLSLLGGIDARYYRGSHFQVVHNLIGGDYAIDNSNKNQPTGFGYTSYGMKREGDTIGYYNDATVMWGGVFGQVEYKKDKWSVFFTATVSETGYQRIDYFKKKDIVIGDEVFEQAVGFNDVLYYNGTDHIIALNGSTVSNDGDTTFITNPSKPTQYILNANSYNGSSAEARSATTVRKWFLGYTFKTGANYNIDKRNNVFLNIGYLNMPPRFNVVFDNNNKVFYDIENQKVYAFELGYGFKSPKVAVNLNSYYTLWQNKPPQFTPTVVTPDGTFSYNINGMDVIHKGVELDFIYKIAKSLEVEGVASLGDWKTISAKKVYINDENGVLLDSVDFSAVNVHVGDAAQIQLGGSIRYEIIPKLYVKFRYTYFAKNYANFDPLTLTGSDKDRESWMLPNYGLLDFFAGYDFKLKKVKFTIGSSVQNVLNTVYISDAQNGNTFNANSALVYMGMGTRFNMSLRIGF